MAESNSRASGVDRVLLSHVKGAKSGSCASEEGRCAEELMKVRSGDYMRMPGVHWVTACPSGQGTVDLVLS